MSKISSFFSPYMSVKHAIAGLSRINPVYKNFLENAIAFGHPAESALNFLREKVLGSESEHEETLSKSSSLRPDEQASLETVKRKTAPLRAASSIVGQAPKVAGVALGLEALGNQPTEQPNQMKESNIMDAPREGWYNKKGAGSIFDVQNQQTESFDPFQILASYSPQLAQHVKTEIEKGKDLQTIGAILKNSSAFQKDVSKIENDTKQNFFDWLLSLFGKSSSLKQQSVQQTQPQGQPASGARQSILEGINQLSQIIQNSGR